MQSKIKVILIEMKNNVQGINSKVDVAENKINNLEYKEAKKQSKSKKEKEPPKNEDSVTSAHQQSHHGGAGRKRKQGIGNVFEKIVKENFHNLVKERDMQIQETDKSPNKMNPKQSTPRLIIIIMLKVKYMERILKSAK